MRDKGKSTNQLRPFLTIAYYSLRALFRNRATVFFGFAFPLIFISVFGLFGSDSLSVTLGVPEGEQSGPVYQSLSKIDAIKIEEGSEQQLREKLSQGRIAGVLLTGENPKLLISQADPQQAAAVSSLVGGVVDKLNLKMANIENPSVKLEVKEISGRTFRFIDFFLPGMVGFALLTTSITSVSFGLIFLKKTLVLKRIFATPTKGLTILLGQGASRLVMVLLQTLIIVLVGVFAFKFNLVHGVATLFQILILSIIGLLSFLGFGLFVAGIANDENTAAPMTQLFVLPQFLVAGTFFPIDALPIWIQPAVKLLPLAFFNIAIRKITVEGLNIDALAPELIGLFVWALIAYLLASRTFRWE